MTQEKKKQTKEGLSNTVQIEQTTQARKFGATGPRTPTGKEHSRQNSLKHGILSKALLLEGESENEFSSFLIGLRTDLRPVGTLEDTLVEKLATLFWRYRRLVRAETGEIRRSTEFIDWDENRLRAEDANQIVENDSARSRSGGLFDKRVGLIRHIANPIILTRCVELLRGLEQNIETDGFDGESDREILNTLYGTSEHPFRTLSDEYDTWSNTADGSEEERQERGYASPQECVTNVLDLIRTEVKRVLAQGKTQQEVDIAKTRLDQLRNIIPNSPEVDRLLRYEASIERALDRTLMQLERRQRIRQGQTVVADINVNLTE